MTVCTLYARFSPRPDAATSQANAAQLADLRNHAARMGWTVERELSDEDISGDRWDRPGLQEAIKGLKPGDILLAYDVDRIARDSGILAAVMATVFNRGAQIYTLNSGLVTADDPISKLLMTIMGAVAEFQKAMIRKRSAVAMKRKLDAGLITNYPGGKPLPFGYRFIHADRSPDKGGRNVEPDQEELAVRDQIIAWHGAGKGYSRIAQLLNHRGTTYRGKQWDRWDVRRIIKPGSKGRRRAKLPRY